MLLFWKTQDNLRQGISVPPFGRLFLFLQHAFMKRLPYIVSGVLFLLYFFCYQGVLSHVIYYHEQHHLFLFSESYFRQCVRSQGWLGWLTAFIVQFFYIPALGSAVLSSVLTLVYGLSHGIITRIFGRDVLQLSVIPSVLLFIYTMPADHSLSVVTGVFLALLLLWALVLLLCRFLPLPVFPGFCSGFRGSVRGALTTLALAVYAGCGFYCFIHSYNRSERIMLKSEQYVKAKEWDKVLDYTGRYLDTGRSNVLISYFHNLALYHLGELPYRLFDYPQRLGVKALYLPWNSDSRESEYGHLLYEELGYVNEAQRWEFEAMVVWGETAPHLLNLARYNIVNHRPRVAQRFINKLKQSLFYAGEALRLEALAETGRVPGLRNALEGVEDVPARFANVINIGPELQYLCERDTANRMAYDYLMSNLLLSNHVVRFAKNLKLMKRYGISELPPVYEEALYIYKLGVGEEEFAQIGIPVRPETEQRFKRYYELVQKKQTERLQAEFGKTYWFYLNYVSPYGNKVLVN